MTAWRVDHSRNRSAAWVLPFLRYLLIVGMGLAFFPPSGILFIEHGLDTSWKYGINIAGQVGWKFGTDILFTHGPLGFLSSTFGVGHNIAITLTVTAVLFVSQLWLLGQSISIWSSDGLRGLGRAAAATLLLWLMPCTPFENYLLYIVLLSLSVAWFGPHKQACLLWACALTTATLFIKFTETLYCCGAVGMFLVLSYFQDRIKWRQLLWIPACIPFVFIAGYLLYNPSWSGLWKYLRVAWEISGGYSAVMSAIVTPHYIGPTLALGAIYAGVLGYMAIFNRPRALYLLLFSGSVVMAMKHGLVRADVWYFAEVVNATLPMFSLMLLFGGAPRVRLPKSRKYLILAGIGILVWLSALAGINDLKGKARAYIQTAYLPNWSRWEAVGAMRSKIVKPCRGDYPLPYSFVEAVGTKSVAFYPMEISFAAYNNIRLSVMPVLQAYSAYTPYLDEQDAVYFSNESTAPAFVVFSLRTLDGRWPLIESPLTWGAIYENYDVLIPTESYLLLQRREQARHIQTRVLSTHPMNAAQELILPGNEGFIFIRVKMELTPWGRIVQWFYRIPPVFLRVALADETVVEGRCIPANLASPTLVSFLPLPTHLQQTADFLRAEQGANNVSRIVFVGPGLKYYRQPMSVSLLAGRVVEAGTP